MKRTVSKKIIIALLSAIVAVCMGFAVLLSRPAAQAKAEESYSEIWIINEKWDYSKAFSAEINGRVSDGSEYEQYRKFSKFEIKKGGNNTFLNCGNYAVSVVSVDSNAVFVYQIIPQALTITYDEWKYTFGKVTFYSDTSATEYSELRAWLEQNATKQTTETPAETAKYTLTFKDGEKVLYTLSVESGKAVNLAEHPEINESAVKAGYTFKGWATTQDGTVIAKNGYLPNITSDTTLYAVYEKGGTDPTEPDTPDVPETTEYKVVFLVDNLVAYTATVESGKAVSFADYPELSEKIKKDGYTFKGWKIEGQDEIYTDGIPAQNKTTVLVAVFEKNVLGIDGVSKAGSIVLTVAIGIVGVYFLFKLFGGKRRRR